MHTTPSNCSCPIKYKTRTFRNNDIFFFYKHRNGFRFENVRSDHATAKSTIHRVLQKSKIPAGISAFPRTVLILLFRDARRSSETTIITNGVEKRIHRVVFLIYSSVCVVKKSTVRIPKERFIRHDRTRIFFSPRSGINYVSKLNTMTLFVTRNIAIPVFCRCGEKKVRVMYN